MMELKESRAYCKVEEDKEAAFKQFTQCCLLLDTQLNIGHQSGI